MRKLGFLLVLLLLVLLLLVQTAPAQTSGDCIELYINRSLVYQTGICPSEPVADPPPPGPEPTPAPSGPQHATRGGE